MPATFLMPSKDAALSMHFRQLRHIVFTALTPYELRSSFLNLLTRSLQAHRSKARCIFLKTCIDEHIIPSSHSGLHRYNGLDHPFAPHTRSALTAILNYQLDLKEEAFCIARHTRRAFFQSCPPHLLETCFILCKRHLEYHTRETEVSHRYKLDCLIRESLWSKAPLLECVTNISSKTLTDAQHQVLGLGLSFALPPRADTLTDFLVSFNNLHKYGKDL